mgnify:CR=1 FL=1
MCFDHAKNIKYDKGDAVCADSYGRSACKLGGESSSIVAVLDASSMQRELELKTPPGAIKNVSCLRVKIPTADGGLLLESESTLDAPPPIRGRVFSGERARRCEGR